MAWHVTSDQRSATARHQPAEPPLIFTGRHEYGEAGGGSSSSRVSFFDVQKDALAGRFYALPTSRSPGILRCGERFAVTGKGASHDQASVPRYMTPLLISRGSPHGRYRSRDRETLRPSIGGASGRVDQHDVERLQVMPVRLQPPPQDPPPLPHSRPADRADRASRRDGCTSPHAAPSSIVQAARHCSWSKRNARERQDACRHGPAG